jgi:hypothetical protein
LNPSCKAVHFQSAFSYVRETCVIGIVPLASAAVIFPILLDITKKNW